MGTPRAGCQRFCRRRDCAGVARLTSRPILLSLKRSKLMLWQYTSTWRCQQVLRLAAMAFLRYGRSGNMSEPTEDIFDNSQLTRYVRIMSSLTARLCGAL